MSIVKESRAVEFDLTSTAFKRDPFPTFARMGEQGPVIRVRIPLVGEVWMATTYEAVNDLLRDHPRFVQSPVTAGNRGMGISSAGCRRASSRWPRTCCSATRPTIVGSAASSIRRSGGRASSAPAPTGGPGRLGA